MLLRRRTSWRFSRSRGTPRCCRVRTFERARKERCEGEERCKGPEPVMERPSITHGRPITEQRDRRPRLDPTIDRHVDSEPDRMTEPGDHLAHCLQYADAMS